MALSMIMTVVPVFGITAGAAGISDNGPYEQTKGQSVARNFGPYYGKIEITYDVVFNTTSLTTNDFVGFGQTSWNSNDKVVVLPTFSNSAIGMQGAENNTAKVGFRNGDNFTGTFEVSQGETYSVSLTTDTTNHTYSGTVLDSNGNTVASFTNAAYRATGTTELNAFMNFNNGSTSGRVTVSNLVIKASDKDFEAVAVPTESVNVDGTYYKLSGNNLITNPGFELNDGTFSKDSWRSSATNATFGATGTDHSYEVYNGGYAYLDGASTTSNEAYTPHGGNYALGTRWNDNGTGLCSFYNDFAVESNTTYYLSYWVKAYTADDGLVWAGAVADTSVTATANDNDAVWIANDDDNPSHKKVNATEWTQVQQIITTGADQTAIQVNAYYLGESYTGAKPYFVFDDFVLAKAEVDTSYNKISVTVDLTADGTVVGTIDSSEGYEGYVGETVTVKAGVYAGQYYLNSDTASTAITSDGKASVEVKALNIFTWDKSSNAATNSDGTYNAGNVVTWGNDRYAYAYATIPSYDPETQELVIEVEAVYNNGYYREAAPLATVKSMDAAALKAVDLTAGADATAAIDAIEKTEVASVDFYDKTGDTYKVTLDQERTAAKVQIPVELAEGEIALLFEKDQSTDQGGIAVITSVEVKAIDKPTVNVEYKVGGNVVYTETGRYFVGTEVYNIPASTTDDGYYLKLGDKAYIVTSSEAQSYTVNADDITNGVINKTVTLGLVHDNAVTFDGFLSQHDGSNLTKGFDIYAKTDNENSIYLTGITGGVLNYRTDDDNVSTVGEGSVDGGKPRIGIVSFNVPDNYEEGKIVKLNLYIYSKHKQLKGNNRIAFIPTDYDVENAPDNTANSDETGSVSADSVAGNNEPISFANISACTATDGDFHDETEWITADVTEAVAAAKSNNKDVVTFFISLPSGLAKAANMEKTVLGGDYEGKAAYLEVVNGNTVTVKGASYITKNGSKIEPADDATEISTVIATDGSVKAYDSAAATADTKTPLLVASTDGTGEATNTITSAGTYVVVPKITASLGFNAAEAFNIIFTFDGIGTLKTGAKISSETENSSFTGNDNIEITEDGQTIGVTVASTNLPYKATATVEGASVNSEWASIYSLVVDEIVNGEYATEGDNAITAENLDKVNKVLASGGLYLTYDSETGKYTLPKENLEIMTVENTEDSDGNITSVTVTLTQKAQKLGLLFNNDNTINASVDKNNIDKTNVAVSDDKTSVMVTIPASTGTATAALTYGEVIMLDAVQLEFVPPETVEEAEADDEFEVIFDGFEDIM